jgi:hypothetical protein
VIFWGLLVGGRGLGFAFAGQAVPFGVVGFAARALPFGVSAFALASACCLRPSSVAPVRGGTYFSLPPQRKVGKRKRLTPPALVFA